MRRLRIGIVVIICLMLPAAARTDELADRINAVISAPVYRQAHWGILVVDADTGKPLYSLNPDRFFVPASTTKLYTCAAALVTFGPKYKFETPVYRTGDVVKGRLEGDLVLVASGDPTLGGRTNEAGKMVFTDDDHTYANSDVSKSTLTRTNPLAGLEDLARQVAKSGIKAVAGDVLIDDRLFNHERGTGTGPDLLTPIVVNDNVIDIEVSPADRVDAPARVRVRPGTKFATGEIKITTVAEGQPTYVEIHVLDRRHYLVRGQIAMKFRPVLRNFPIAEPAAFARALFIQALREAGVTVAVDPLREGVGKLPDPKAYTSLQRVALYESPPLSELLKVTLKVSHNLYASLLPMLLAAKNDKRTLVDGLRAQKKVLEKLGVDTDSVSFGSGAGGSPDDKTTPHAVIQLLRAMSQRPDDYAVYRKSLPVLGVDGTLAEVGADSEVREKVQAKSGTLLAEDLLNDRMLLRSKALAGMMTTARGKNLLFAMFVNDVPLPRGQPPSREGKVLGKLCEIIYQSAP